MSASQQHHRLNYSHLETDAEFSARLTKNGVHGGTLYAAERLDDWAWSIAKAQRRIVWADVGA